jgi:hypothetical protein
VTNSFEENDCENTNTHAHLRRRWSLSGRVGFGVFVEVKCIFSTTPEAEIFSKSLWIETEANGGH